MGRAVTGIVLVHASGLMARGLLFFDLEAFWVVEGYIKGVSVRDTIAGSASEVFAEHICFESAEAFNIIGVTEASSLQGSAIAVQSLPHERGEPCRNQIV